MTVTSRTIVVTDPEVNSSTGFDSVVQFAFFHPSLTAREARDRFRERSCRQGLDQVCQC